MPNRVRRLTVLAVLTLPVMLAGCEMLRLTPEPAPQPVQETPPPAAPVGEPQAERAIPLPARKPSPPVVASAPSPAAAMPAEEHLPRPPVVVGLTRDALIEGGAIRLRPILMTTFALIAGMMPVAIGAGEGADFRAPLGRAVIGGVITSTLLTLIAIPTFYEIFDQWRSWFARKFGFRVAQRTAEHRVPPKLVPEIGD